MSWRDYNNPPDRGAKLARSADVPVRGTLSITIDAFPVLLVRGAAGLRAFVNACPHQYLPLDHKGDHLLSTDGEVLRCTNHSAGFAASDGTGVEGLGLGCALDGVPIEEHDGWIVIAG